jgi:dynein heavy chain
VLDGDIDPEWIESMNTVMDDNKVLTLASNERISLNPTMRMLFEIGDLRNATPATVSRAGVLYMNEGDVGWHPMLLSWLDTRNNEKQQEFLRQLFDQYMEVSLEQCKKHYRLVITNIMSINLVRTTMYVFMLSACR